MVVDIIGDGAKVQLLGEVYELTISFDGSGTGVEASEVTIVDEGGYYESSNVEGALQEAGANIDTLASDIEGLDVRVSANEASITDINSDIEGLDTRVSANESAITTINGDISGLDTRVSATESSITAINSDISGLDTRLDTAETDISDLQTEVGNAIKVGDNELLNSEHVQIYSDNLFYFFTGTIEGSGRGLMVARSDDGTLESYLDLNQTNAFIRHVNVALSKSSKVQAKDGIVSFEATDRADFYTPSKYISDYAELFDASDRFIPDSGWVRAKVSDLESAVYAILDAYAADFTAINSTLSGYANTFASKRYTSAIQTLAISSGLIAWDMSLGQRAKVTLTASATLSNPTNATAAFPDLEVKQDATGGRVLSFGTNFITPASYTAAPTTANSYTLYHFQLRSDGKLSVTYTHYAS